MNTTPAESEGDLRGRGEDQLLPRVWQEFSASGTAQQAALGYGTLNVYMGGRERSPEPAVSIAAPVGQRDEDMPLRGREALLTDLVGPGPCVRVLHGLGGCGKTRLALEVAFRAQQCGTEVWWVSAADPDVLAVSMRALGRRLGSTDAELEHGDVADVIWQRLTARRDPWLLVIDNADDAQILAGAGTCVADGRGWLRPVSRKTGMVLVTSRDGSKQSWGSWSRRHRLDVLPADPAAAVLTDHAGHHPGLGSEEEARLLASRLGGLPLALKIAGSFLAESAAIPAAFADTSVIRTYRQYRDALQSNDLETVFPAPGGELTAEQARGLIGRTWELTLDLLDARSLPEARRVLRLLASLAAAPVPFELLLHPATLAASELLRDITGSRLWQAIKALDDFGLIDLYTSGPDPAAIRLARLHPLVYDTSRPAAGPERLAYLELAAQMLHRVADDEETGAPENPLAWLGWQLLAPHCSAVFHRLALDPGCPDGVFDAAAVAAHMAARYQAAHGFHAEAEAEFGDILAARLRVQGPDHRHTLGARHQIALEMLRRGSHAEAEAEFREVLAAQLRLQGPDHQETLLARHQVAAAMAARGAHAEAEAEFREVLAAQLRVKDPDDPDTLTTRHELAAAMAARGAHAEAEAEYRDILAARVRTLGPNHPHTAAARHQIALQIAAQGKHAEAEAEFRKVLTRQLRVQAPDHPETLFTRHCIAQEISTQGKHAAAEAEFRDILAVQLRVQGPDHPDTLEARTGIAIEMAWRGQHTEAEAEFRDILATRRRVQGHYHPSTLEASKMFEISKRRNTRSASRPARRPYR